jgi:hypothetical protein
MKGKVWFLLGLLIALLATLAGAEPHRVLDGPVRGPASRCEPLSR